MIVVLDWLWQHDVIVDGIGPTRGEENENNQNDEENNRLNSPI